MCWRLSSSDCTAAWMPCSRPSICDWISPVELAVRTGGALLGLVSRYYAVGQLAGAKALEILQGGHSPEQAGVQTLPRFALMVNMAAAHRLRMYPPMDMLNFAEIIAVGDTAAGAT